METRNGTLQMTTRSTLVLLFFFILTFNCFSNPNLSISIASASKIKNPKLFLWNPTNGTVSDLSFSGVQLILVVSNKQVKSINGSTTLASKWLAEQTLFPAPTKTAIVVGYQQFIDTRFTETVLVPTMAAIHSVLRASDFQNTIKVSTAVSSSSVINKPRILEKTLISSFVSSTRSFLVLVDGNQENPERVLQVRGWRNSRRKLLGVLKADRVSSELWCVAKNNAEDSALQAALDWACGTGGADCRPIQQGGACFEPNNLQYHASYAFNDYYLRNAVSDQSCDFGGSAALTSLNPSNGNCIFPSSLSTRNGSFSGGTTTAAGLGANGSNLSNGAAGNWAMAAHQLILGIPLTMAALIFHQ